MRSLQKQYNSRIASYLESLYWKSNERNERTSEPLYIYVYYTHSDITLSRIRIHLNECPILNNNIIEPKKKPHFCYTFATFHTWILYHFFYILIVLSLTERNVLCNAFNGRTRIIKYSIAYTNVVWINILWTIQFGKRCVYYSVALFTQNG